MSDLARTLAKLARKLALPLLAIHRAAETFELFGCHAFDSFARILRTMTRISCSAASQCLDSLLLSPCSHAASISASVRSDSGAASSRYRLSVSFLRTSSYPEHRQSNDESNVLAV